MKIVSSVLMSVSCSPAAPLKITILGYIWGCYE